MRGFYRVPAGKVLIQMRAPDRVPIVPIMVTLEQGLRDDGRLLLRLKGRFDSLSAWSLVRRVDAAGARGIVIDFTSLEGIEDASLSVLAELLQRYRGRVDLVGLREHHLRLLSYLGVPADPQTHH